VEELRWPSGKLIDIKNASPEWLSPPAFRAPGLRHAPTCHNWGLLIVAASGDSRSAAATTGMVKEVVFPCR